MSYLSSNKYAVCSLKEIMGSLDDSSLTLCHLILTKCNIYSSDMSVSIQTTVFSLRYSGTFGGG